MKYENEPVVFNSSVQHTILPNVFVDTLSFIATPSVLNLSVLICSGSVVTVTNFLNGANGQTIRLLGDGTTTIDHNTNIKTSLGTPKLLSTDHIYLFTLINDVWYENES